MSVIEAIKARVDIVDLISESVQLRKSGRSYSGFCPFHANRKTPAFAVFPESQLWKCFGECNQGGDVFKFVMKKEGMDFPEALKLLAVRAGVELRPRTPQMEAEEAAVAKLRQALAAAATYFHNLLLKSPQAEHARQHLLKRGLSVLTVQKFQLGYALKSWEALYAYLTEKGFAAQELVDAGLVVQREAAASGDVAYGVYDRFRDRLMIPIHDASGKLTGFGARALNSEDLPKFLNSPQTALFDKGRTLYGLHLARKAVRQTGTAVLVEGYLDVMAAHQAGFANVVSPMGTALSEAQLRLLKRYAPRMVLALDADAAGDRATLRGLTVARDALDREFAPEFDPRGLVKSEGRLKADIRVITLPGEQDPDEIVLARPDEWAQLVDAAEPVVEYVIRILTAGRNLDDPKVKAEIADEVLPLIQDVANPVEREAYRQKLARALRVDERALTTRAARPLVRSRRRRAGTGGAPQGEEAAGGRGARKEAPTPTSNLEGYCLGALVRQPDLLYRADRHLAELGLERLTVEDFLSVEHQEAFRLLKAALVQDDLDPVDYLREHVDEELLPRVEAWLSDPGAAPADEPSTVEAVLNALTRLRRRSVDSTLLNLRFLVEEAQTQGDSLAEAFQPAIVKLAGALQKLDRALASQH